MKKLMMMLLQRCQEGNPTISGSEHSTPGTSNSTKHKKARMIPVKSDVLIADITSEYAKNTGWYSRDNTESVCNFPFSVSLLRLS